MRVLEALRLGGDAEGGPVVERGSACAGRRSATLAKAELPGVRRPASEANPPASRAAVSGQLCQPHLGARVVLGRAANIPGLDQMKWPWPMCCVPVAPSGRRKDIDHERAKALARASHAEPTSTVW